MEINTTKKISYKSSGTTKLLDIEKKKLFLSKDESLQQKLIPQQWIVDRSVKNMVYDGEKKSDEYSEPSVGFFSTLSFFESLGSDESMVSNGNGEKIGGKSSLPPLKMAK